MRNTRKKPLKVRDRSEIVRLRESLKGYLVKLDFTQLPATLRPKAKRVDREALFRSLPRLDPPLSATIIEERREQL